MSANYGLKDEIRDYWGRQASHFDASIGHGIRTDGEIQAWRQVFGTLLGDLEGRRVLELASGTGEITRTLLAAGADVTGIDLTEPMIEVARAKYAETPRARFFQGDAEETMEPDGTYDAVVCRHLVWTLVDPRKAFADWFRVLKPGGRVAIIDGDWVTLPWRGRARRRLATWLDRLAGASDPHHIDGRDEHESIHSRVHFSGGVRPEALVAMLETAGFAHPTFAGLDAVEAAQKSGATRLGERLRIGCYDRIALSMRKPSSEM